MPERQIILVATGTDRSGLLDDISLYLHDRHVNIQESRVSLLRGQFALLLLLGGEEENVALIEQNIGELSEKVGVHLEARSADAAACIDCTPLRLTASGDDPAETVYRLSHLMRVLNVNIENIETNSTKGAAGVKGSFSLEMDLSVPRATPVMMLKQYVQSLADELTIQCDVKNL